MQFPPPEIGKQYAVLLSIHAGSSNTKISYCLSVNLRTVQRIQKELNEFNGGYKGTVAQKPCSDYSDKKRTKFVCEIQALMNNDPSKLIPGMWECLSFFY